MVFLTRLYCIESVTISGNIIDVSQNPLPGSNVILVNTTYGGAADVDGFYSLEVPVDFIANNTALIKALDISGKSINKVKVVVNGAGASAQACTELFKNSGVKSENIIMLDRKGVIYEGRTEAIDQWKSRYAVKTKHRSLKDAVKGADVFLGLSAKGVLKKEMVKSMAKNPIIFACALFSLKAVSLI